VNFEKKMYFFDIQQIYAVSSQKFGLWTIGECDVIDDAYAAVHNGLVERDAVGRRQTTAERKRWGEKILVHQHALSKHLYFGLKITNASRPRSQLHIS